jgi:hypothetical protein
MCGDRCLPVLRPTSGSAVAYQDVERNLLLGWPSLAVKRVSFVQRGHADLA